MVVQLFLWISVAHWDVQEASSLLVCPTCQLKDTCHVLIGFKFSLSLSALKWCIEQTYIWWSKPEIFIFIPDLSAVCLLMLSDKPCGFHSVGRSIRKYTRGHVHGEYISTPNSSFFYFNRRFHKHGSFNKILAIL